MERNVISRSISFDPEVFAKMEDRRRRLLMGRSEYVKRCILRDMVAGGSMNIDELPKDIASKVVSVDSRMKKRK